MTEHNEHNLIWSSEEYASRFQGLLDSYVFCDIDELTEGAKELRKTLIEFCEEHL